MFFNVNLGFANVYTPRNICLYPPNFKFLEITLLFTVPMLFIVQMLFIVCAHAVQMLLQKNVQCDKILYDLVDNLVFYHTVN